MYLRWKLCCGAFLFVVSATLVGQEVDSSKSVFSLAPPVHPATIEQVREYMQMNGAEARTHRLMKTMVQTARATADPALPPAFWDDMDTEFAKLDVVGLATPAYQKYLSSEDMEAVLAFYKSPAGQHLLASSPMIESLAGAAGKAEGLRIGAEVGAKYKDEIAARRKMLDDQAAARAAKPVEPDLQLKQEQK